MDEVKKPLMFFGVNLTPELVWRAVILVITVTSLYNRLVASDESTRQRIEGSFQILNMQLEQIEGRVKRIEAQQDSDRRRP